MRLNDLREIITEFSNEEREPEKRDSLLLRFQKILEDLEARIGREKDEIKLGQIEFASLSQNQNV